jgi:5-methylcytosine-specific restriction protein B
LDSEAIDLGKLQELLNESRSETAVRMSAPRVLIVDEINRGNVSRIFGELITLVESSKRLGAKEAITVTLPYSRKPFGIPGNVYLLGTMNTADRSLAGLDIALRRRFVFQEMPPRPDLLKGIEVEGVDIGELLQVMNERIEVLLDREHRLGHAYFMPLLDAQESKRLHLLAEIFQRQVLPLLEEYFFEDWERIRWVLNDHRKRELKHQFVRRPESEAKDLSALFGPAAEQLQDRRWALNPAAFAAADSYRLIIQGDA